MLLFFLMQFYQSPSLNELIVVKYFHVCRIQNTSLLTGAFSSSYTQFNLEEKPSVIWCHHLNSLLHRVATDTLSPAANRGLTAQEKTRVKLYLLNFH